MLLPFSPRSNILNRGNFVSHPELSCLCGWIRWGRTKFLLQCNTMPSNGVQINCIAIVYQVEGGVGVHNWHSGAHTIVLLCPLSVHTIVIRTHKNPHNVFFISLLYVHPIVIRTHYCPLLSVHLPPLPHSWIEICRENVNTWRLKYPEQIGASYFSSFWIVWWRKHWMI